MHKRYKNRCVFCGRFLRDDDPYGDFHASHGHPVEYAEQMRQFRNRQSANSKENKT